MATFFAGCAAGCAVVCGSMAAENCILSFQRWRKEQGENEAADEEDVFKTRANSDRALRY